MAQTPDRNPGTRYEEELILTNEGTGDPTEIGALRRVGDAIKARDGTGVFDLRAGSGLSESGHKTLYQLIHFVADGPGDGFTSGAYREVLPAGDPFPTSITWWTSSGKTQKIVELLITYDIGKRAIQEQWKMYSATGVLLVTATDTIAYSGPFETSRTRVIT